MGSENKKNNTSGNLNWSTKINLLYILVFFSGMAALIYELIWIRMLNITFGVSSFALATVISVFLLGLGLGSYYFGKKVEKIKNILKTYALLELSIALFSTLSFVILKYSNIYDWAYSMLNPHDLYLLSVIRLVISIIILIIPSFLIGGTIPLIVKYLIRDDKRLGSIFSTIYYINTLGGFFGIMLVGFFLIRQLGVWKSFVVAVFINLIIFLTLFIFKKIKKYSDITREISNESFVDQSQPIKIFLPVLFLTGFIALGFEILWMRILINFGSGTTLSSTMILGGFLLGFTAGSFFISKRIDEMKKPLKNFILYLFLTGLSGACILFIFSQLNNFLSNQFATYGRLLSESWLGFIFALIIASVSGTLFPLGLRLYAGNKYLIGQKTGQIYWINSLGTVAGSLVMGFIFIPLLGIKYSGAVLIILCFLIAIYLIIRLNLNKKKNIVISLILLTCSCLIIFTSGNTFHRQTLNQSKLFYAEGLSATVTVFENNQQDDLDKILNVDSQTVAGTYPTGVIDSKILAHLPILLTKNPQSVATIGYGTGGTSYSMAQYDLEVYALEIEKQVIEASQYFRDLNYGIEKDPALHIIIDDARHALQQSENKFDTIVTDVTNLKYKSNPYLYTKEYFQIMENRLTAQGVGAAWVPLGGLSFSDLKILTASFRNVFPHTTIWYYNIEPTGFLVFIGTPEKLSIDLNILKEKMTLAQDDRRVIGLDDEFLFGSMLLLGEKDVADLTDGIDLHTDDRPILEFSDLKYYALYNPFENLKNLLKYQKEIYKTYFIMDKQQENILLENFFNSRQLIQYYIANY